MIKKYNRKDFSKIKTLCKSDKYFKYYHVYFKDPHYNVFVSWHKSKPTGIVVVSVDLDNLDLEYVFVHPDSRGKGLGRALLRYIEKLAKSKKLVGVRIDTSFDNVNALKFYKREGYAVMGSVKNYYDDFGKQIFLWKKV